MRAIALFPIEEGQTPRIAIPPLLVWRSRESPVTPFTSPTTGTHRWSWSMRRRDRWFTHSRFPSDQRLTKYLQENYRTSNEIPTAFFSVRLAILSDHDEERLALEPFWASHSRPRAGAPERSFTWVRD